MLFLINKNYCIRVGESQINYVKFLNEMFEKYLIDLNTRTANWPDHWKSEHILGWFVPFDLALLTSNFTVLYVIVDMVRAFQFEFPKLHNRMRALVKQRQSDATSTPNQVTAHIPPGVFFTVVRYLGTTFVPSSMKASCYVSAAEKLDCIFPPSEEELETDGKVDPYYGHELRSRWYDQRFNLPQRTQDAETLAMIPWAARQYVLQEKGVSLEYNMKTWQLQVKCVWKGAHKRPNRDDDWIEGRLGSAPTKKLKLNLAASSNSAVGAGAGVALGTLKQNT